MNETSQNVPYIVHEADMARMERSNRRLWILLIVMLCLLVGTNAAWIAYESQFQTVDLTQEVQQEADGNGNNTFVGGDVYGEADDENNG